MADVLVFLHDYYWLFEYGVWFIHHWQMCGISLPHTSAAVRSFNGITQLFMESKSNTVTTQEFAPLDSNQIQEMI